MLKREIKVSEKNKEKYVADKLTYKKEHLEMYLANYERFISSRNSWQVSLSVFLTLLVAVGSEKAGWLTYQNHIELALTLCLFLSFISLIITVYRALTTDPVKKLKKDLFTKYINQPDENALFIVKRLANDEEQILVYRCKTWGCYFLPYTRLKLANPESESKTQIANILDLKEDEIEIEMLLQRHEISEKYHPQENVVKEYHSYYFHLYASNKFSGKDLTQIDNFSVGKKDFEWKTLNEIEKDERTQAKNQDVLDILRKNKSSFITNVSTFK